MKSLKAAALRAVVTAGLPAVLLAGCFAPARHDAPRRPEVPSTWRNADAASGSVSLSADSEAPMNTASGESKPEWWHAFGDPSLDALVEQVLTQSDDLAVTAMRARRTQLEAELVAATTGPSLSAGASALIRRRLDDPRVDEAGGVSGSVAYELDLWGKIAAQRDEQAWRAQASEADREAATLSLIGRAAKLYWGLGGLNETIAVGRDDIADAERTVAFAEARHAAGASSALDLARARQSLAATRAAQTRWHTQREVQRNALALLLGRAAGHLVAEPASLAAMTVPNVRPRLPVAVLARRPDVRAAEWRLRARLARVDFEHAALYPSFSLTGQLGTSSEMLANALQNPVASVLASLALPFVQWNTARAKIAVSNAQFEEASIEFRQQLYRGLADVEDALAAKAQLDAEARQRERAFDEAARIAVLEKARFTTGATTIESWLQAQAARREARLTLIDNRRARLDNRMDLFLALGG